jgi:hypothetical protein
MRNTPIDELIVDAYAKLYLEITPTLAEAGDLPEKMAEVIMPDAQPTDQPSKSRLKGPNRRDLLRKAEVTGSGPAAATPQVLALRQVIASELGSATSPTAQAASGTPRNRSRETGATEPEDKDEPPGSIHDSADDESELSELDDTVELDEFKRGLQVGHVLHGAGEALRRAESEDDSPGTFMGDHAGEEVEEGEEDEGEEEGEGDENDEEQEEEEGDEEDLEQEEQEEDEEARLQRSAEAMDVDTRD